MRRSDDDEETAAHYRWVRLVKGSVGIVSGVGVVVVAIRGANAETLPVIVVLALLAGVMIDAPGTTKLISKILEAIPWGPKKGSSTKER